VLGTATLAAWGGGAIPLPCPAQGRIAAALPDWTSTTAVQRIRRGQLGCQLRQPSTAWTSAALDGSTFGEPLEDAGRVFVATENDSVYALAPTAHGLVAGEPRDAGPANKLGCGDVSPTVGITGTRSSTRRWRDLRGADEWNGSTAVHVCSGSTSTPATSR